MKFKVKVEMLHTFTQLEEYTAEVNASSAQEAMDMARKEAIRNAWPDCCDAERDGTDIDSMEIITADPEPGEEPMTIRCDRTPDLFQGAHAC